MRYWKDKRKPISDGVYKSQLETIFSKWLTIKKIPFIYEPCTFKTKKGKYTPDFYLTETNQYIEIKPNMDFLNRSYINLLRQFAKENKKEIIVFTLDGAFLLAELWQKYDEKTNNFIGNWTMEWLDEMQPIEHGKCSKCGTDYLCGSYGTYRCRKCGYHNGRHDILKYDVVKDFVNFYYAQRVDNK